MLTRSFSGAMISFVSIDLVNGLRTALHSVSLQPMPNRYQIDLQEYTKLRLGQTYNFSISWFGYVVCHHQVLIYLSLILLNWTNFLLRRSVQLNCLWRYGFSSHDHMTVTDCRRCLILSGNLFFKLDLNVEFIFHGKNNFSCNYCCTISTMLQSWII